MKKIIVAVLFVFPFLFQVQAQDFSRTISIDSNYETSKNSNKSIANAGLEIIDMDSLLQDGLANIEGFDTKIARSAILFYSVLSPISNRVTLSFHEFGHGSRINAYGGDARYYIGDSVSGRGHNNFFNYFIHSLAHPYSSGLTSNNRYVTPYDFAPYAFTEAAGVNNQMYLSEKIQDKMLKEGSVHMAYGYSYFTGKVSTLTYKNACDSGGDKCNMVNYYKSVGYNIRKKDMHKANLISLFASADTYSFLKGYHDFLFEGKTKAEVLSFGNFMLPNVSNYYNVGGISYKIDSGYRFNQYATAIFSYEKIMKGKSQSEFSTGVHLSYRDFGLFLKTIVNKPSTFEADLSYKINKRTILHLGFDSYNADSLYGQRNIPSYEHGNKMKQAWAKISLLY